MSISESDTRKVRECILSQLNSQSIPHFERLSLAEPYRQVHALFEHTVRDRQGLLVLLTGPRALGKTALVDQALKTLAPYEGQYIVVRLSAHVHPDDHAAVREIARQLDAAAKQSAGESQSRFQQPAINDTFANVLSVLENSAAADSMAVIFVVDEIDRFADAKQTLLYNLLDLAQSAPVPICVVGISTKITVRELFEKRVRSRFSHRTILLARPLTVEEYWDGAKLALLLPEDTIAGCQDPGYGREWNARIESLPEMPVVHKLITRLYYSTRNYKHFGIHSTFAISQISPEKPFALDADFGRYAAAQPPSPIQALLQSLSTLELLLAIAAARWMQKYDLQTINFNLAYREYEDMMKQFNTNATTLAASSPSKSNSRIMTNIKVSQKVWSAQVLQNCWEALYRQGLISDPPGSSTTGDGHIAAGNVTRSYTIDDSKMVQFDTNLEELGHILDDQDPFKRLTKL